MNWQRLADRIDRALELIAAGLLAVTVASMGLQILGRYLFNYSPNWSEEVARMAVVWMALLGAAGVLRSGGHLAISALLLAVPPPLRAVLMWLRDAAILATVGVVAFAGFNFAMMNSGQESPALEISMGIPYGALVVGAALMALQLVLSRLAGVPIPAAEGVDGSV